MTLSRELRAILHGLVRGERSFEDVFDWLTDHVQEVEDALVADTDLQRVDATAWGAVMEWQQGDQDEMAIREQVKRQLGAPPILTT